MTGLVRRDAAGQKWASGLRVSPESAVAILRGTENRAPSYPTAASVSRATTGLDLAAAGFQEVELCALPELVHQAGFDSRLSASRCLIDRCVAHFQGRNVFFCVPWQMIR